MSVHRYVRHTKICQFNIEKYSTFKLQKRNVTFTAANKMVKTNYVREVLGLIVSIVFYKNIL